MLRVIVALVLLFCVSCNRHGGWNGPEGDFFRVQLQEEQSPLVYRCEKQRGEEKVAVQREEVVYFVAVDDLEALGHTITEEGVVWLEYEWLEAHAWR